MRYIYRIYVIRYLFTYNNAKMKKLIIYGFLVTCAFNTTAQNLKTSQTVQCAGKTKQDARCKVRINPKNPKSAIMDGGGGVYY